MRSFVIIRRDVYRWLGRRSFTAPAPGTGVLLKKLRSRWSVCDPMYWKSRPMLLPSSRCRSRLHWFLRALGSFRVGEMMSGLVMGPATPEGLVNDKLGFARSEVYVVTAATGGLFVKNVNVFI